MMGGGRERRLPLSLEQVHSWRETGSVVVHDLLEPDLVEAVRERALALYGTNNNVEDFGASSTEAIFPAKKDENAVINEIPMHPKIISAVAQLLDTTIDGLRLSQCELWQKRGKEVNVKADENHMNGVDEVEDTSSNNDQRIHVDCFNHYLTFPSEWYKPEAVAMIVYYSDSESCMGCTAVVPREGVDDPAYNPSDIVSGPHPFLLTPGGRADMVWLNARAKVEATLRKSHPEVAAFRATHLYPREKQMEYKRGTILFYRLDTWHRGTPVKVGAVRYAHNLVFKKAGADHITSWNHGAARAMYSLNQTMEKIIANRPEAVVLGYPARESGYWDQRIKECVEARFEFLRES